MKSMFKTLTMVLVTILALGNTTLCYAQGKNLFQKAKPQPQAPVATEEKTAAFTPQKTRIALYSPTQIKIPEEFGTIKEAYEAKTQGKEQTIIIQIQDIHANYEGQKNLANILDHLISTYGLSVILVEGGITDRDFSYLRAAAPLEERKEKAEKLLKDAVITGETYIDIASDYPLKFQGIEDRPLYEANMEAFLTIDKFREDAIKFLTAVRNIVENLKLNIYTAELKEFDRKKNEFSDEKIKLTEYIEYLRQITKEKQVDLSEFKDFNTLADSVELEKKLDFKKVEEEREKLINDLLARLNPADKQRLVSKSMDLKQTKISQANFYEYLIKQAKANYIDLSEFPQLENYSRYTSGHEEVNIDKLFKDMRIVEEKITQGLCQSQEQLQLVKISSNLKILEDILNQKLTPDEFDYYNQHKIEFNVTSWLKFLDTNARKFNLEKEVPTDASLIEGNLGLLEEFYLVAGERDSAFLRNSLKKLKKENENIGMLICGGFHTPHFTKLLRENNISYCIIAPKTTQMTSDEEYRRILKESYDSRIWDELEEVEE